MLLLRFTQYWSVSRVWWGVCQGQENCVYHLLLTKEWVVTCLCCDLRQITIGDWCGDLRLIV